MKRLLNHLVAGLSTGQDGLPATPIGGIVTHADRVQPGDLFIAIHGNQFDGHDYIPQAIDRGAAAIISNGREMGSLPVPHIAVANPRRAASWVAAEFYQHPSHHLHITGITGTNGKTTTAALVYFLLQRAGFRVAQVGTLGVITNGHSGRKNLTTPDPVTLHKLFHHLHQEGFSHVVMEASSHALDQYRVADVAFDLALFTNLSPEHLDYHGSMQAYYHAKARLFKSLPVTAAAIVNCDDPYGERIQKECSAPVITTALQGRADVRFEKLKTSLEGISGTILAGEHRFQVRCPLMGRFNAENVLAAVTAAISLEIPGEVIETGLAECPPVPGRMEVFTTPRQATVVIDYAHTPDAYEKVLSTLQNLKPGGARITVVFGCGGDRDQTKRPVMARIAERYAERCFITPDNPRTEPVARINVAILQGFSRQCYTVFTDRGEALTRALNEAGAGDIVVVLGKGREDYQDVDGEKVPYSDLKIIQDYCHAD